MVRKVLGLPNDTGADTIGWPITINATAITPDGTRQVVQDEVSTRALEALLGVVLVLSLTSWILEPHTDVLPDSATSISVVTTLIRNGNLPDRMAELKAPGPLELGEGERVYLIRRSPRGGSDSAQDQDRETRRDSNGEEEQVKELGIWILKEKDLADDEKRPKPSLVETPSIP